MRPKTSSSVALVLGAVFIILGLLYGNSALWILGGIVLALGLWSKFGRKGEQA